MSTYNRLHNVGNPHQGPSLKVLCVCSAGLLRSPTMAWLLCQEPWGFNTRAAGLSKDYALIPVDPVLIAWADEIITVEKELTDELISKFKPDKTVHTIEIPDQFGYRDPYLVKLMREALTKLYPVGDENYNED